ncbi:NAD-dependent epimerase/dehydratase family protein [Frankia sp. CiP1_Cm_nod2]|uniref:NAD-dependent epimerase/dehydratase family protein n=1 Tax=Frankia sp. CiP1_Cm_nod2 TaxID=2897161 RepID=UPI0020249F44
MKILVTGAAGFIGSHAVQTLAGLGHEVIATDLVDPLPGTPDQVAYLRGELADVLPRAVPGIQEVWHFAANADIPLGARDTGIDFRSSVWITQQVLEAMRQAGVGTLLFPSTSAVYGNGLGPVVREVDGPLLPGSLYGAGKLACEGLISAYTGLFGIRGLVFRLGNAVGGGMSRGIIRDFIAKLDRDPTVLSVLGDGRQRKSYVLVDDVIAGMRYVADLPAGTGAEVYNLAAGGSLCVAEVAHAVARALRLPPPELRPSSTDLSWPGDQPVVELDIEKILATGWRPRLTAAQAVTEAVRRLIATREPA